MTLQYMDGFESVVDNPDMVKRGWNISTVANGGGTGLISVPSRTGTPGRGLMMRGPYSTGTGMPFTIATSVDYGMVPLGKTINALWQTGGFAVGVNASFNKASQLALAMFQPNAICYDGSQYYWAIGYNGTAACVAYSPDLMNWTVTVTTPSQLNNSSFIQVIGSGLGATVIVGGNYYMTYSAGWETVQYYTTNAGQSWAELPYPSNQLTWGSGVATGNAAVPYIFLAQTSNGTAGVQYAMFCTSSTFAASSISSTSSTGTANSLAVGSAGNSSAYYTAWSMARKKQNFVCLMGISGINSASGVQYVPVSYANYWKIAPNNVDLTQASNWVQSASSTLGEMNDICYFAPTNSFYAVGYGGIASAPATGSSGSPQGPTAAWATLVNTGSAYVQSIDTNGSIMVAVGQDPVNTYNGAIWTSTNGTTWTKVNRFINAGTAVSGGYGGAPTTYGYFTGVFWDGARFVLTGSYQASIIATSPDGLNWTPVYYPDYPEQSVPAGCSCMGVYAGTITAAGVYTPSNAGSSTYCAAILEASIVSSNARTITPALVGAYTPSVSNQTPTASVSVASGQSLSHYYELIFTATGVVNQFSVQWALDGVIQGTTSFTVSIANTSDVTSQALFNLPRYGNWTVVDDLYMTDFAADPVGNTGQLGVINIVGGTASTDKQDQFTLNGSAASHAAEVAGALSNSEGSVYTYTVGGKDIYGTNLSIPANYRVQAVQVEAYFSKYGNAGSTGTVGIVSGTHEVDSAAANAATTTPVYASLIQNVDPNTSAQWTIAAAQAAGISITKTT
jgi:hypothetical protein